MIRGIHATLYAQLVKTDTDLQALYEKRYANEPFVDVLPPGSAIPTRVRYARRMSAALPCIARKAVTPWWCCR